MASLALLAKGTIRVTERFLSNRLPYTARQAFANLYRPGNRTTLLLLSMGLGTFLVLSLLLVQENLVTGLFPAERKSQGNAVLFDIQPDQKEGVVAALKQLGLPVLQEAPIVTMRIQSVKGRDVEDILRDPDRNVPRWSLQREYRSTFRAEMVETEKLIAGEWEPRVEDASLPIPVSLEDGIARRLKVGLGDELVFDVQGVPITTRVASLREVEWRRLHPNFFVVFPTGVLEEAPSFYILLTRVASGEQSAQMQREIVKRFPNVSTVDLTLILGTVDSVLSKVSFVIRFMAAFTVGTGLLILAGAILTSRFQRVQESILLRTLGATRSQIFRILLFEYLLLGLFAALSGILLALGGSWALAQFVFEVDFAPALLPLAAALGVVCILTAAIGLLSSRGVCNYPPLEILRAES
jgi:putative ABC transport system permease protein